MYNYLLLNRGARSSYLILLISFFIWWHAENDPAEVIFTSPCLFTTEGCDGLYLSSHSFSFFIT